VAPLGDLAAGGAALGWSAGPAGAASAQPWPAACRDLPDVEAAARARPLPAGPDYTRRDPERETLHRLVREHLRTFYAALEHGFDGASLPDFVREDLQGYVRCGVLSRGFDYAGMQDLLGR
jgi:hypothetical protein